MNESSSGFLCDLLKTSLHVFSPIFRSNFTTPVIMKVSAPEANDGKGKSGILKKATLAERKAEKRRNANERIKSLRIERLRREMDLGALNIKRHERDWRGMMTRIKIPILREELEIMWRTFDRSLDIKDCSTSLILDALETAEEQYQMNLRSHMEAIDRLIRIFRTRLQEQEDHYRLDLQELLATSKNETELINCKENEDEVFLRCIIFGTRQRLDESLMNTQSGAIAKLNALNEDNRNSMRLSSTILEKRLMIHWKELRGVLNEYENETKERRRAYEIIKAKDDRERGIIARQVVTTSLLFETNRKLNKKILQLRTTADRRISMIMEEHKFFQESYWTIKQRFTAEQRSDKARLLTLIEEYNLTQNHLNQLVTKAKKLLIIVQDCSKYETQDEKIMPFSEPVETEASRRRKQSLSNLPNAITCPEVLEELDVKLELFWRRTGTAKIITTELRLERNRLEKESQCLRQCLRHCLSQRYINVSNNDEEMLNDLRKRSTFVDSYEASISSISS